MRALLGLLAILNLAAFAAEVPENLYRGELLTYPGPYAFQIRRPGIILVSDQELEMLADPDKQLNLSLGRGERMESLRQICERAQAQGARTLMLAFDHFFRQYRPGQDTPRRYLPDMDDYIQRVAAIGKFAAGYGLNLELSLLTPLELGSAFAKRTGESGRWMHYRKGLRDPRTGAFSVSLWRQERWVNNKGPIDVADAGVRAFAYREEPVPGTPYLAVDPASIVEIKNGIHVETFPNLVSRTGDYRARRVRIYSSGGGEAPGLDRVLVVQIYRTPEMDYFSPKALPFLKSVVDQYAAAGIRLNGLYSDEMHIQGDWAYFKHHDNGEFTVRYLTDSMAEQFAARYGSQYRDLARYLVYFASGQEDKANDLTAKQEFMHVFGASPEAIRQTALFRARYYHMLQDGVVDLFVQAKRYAEQKMGYRLEARAHATWAQSPTIDFWYTGRENGHRAKYEYTSNFVWSNTVHQAATACFDYFKWGDFLTGNGNDHTEGGWLDRNYYALALASSTGILNQVPYSYAAHWGMPREISERRSALVNAYGAAGAPQFAMVQNAQHRDVDVLMLYPLDLVAAEERFGSWMTQYGYANLVTPAKLLERGRVNGKTIEMAGRRFTTLVALFEPFPPKPLLEMMRRFAENGGRVIWSGPPPLLTFEGDPALSAWQSLFAVDYSPGQEEGILAPGREVRFEGALGGVTPQIILTGFLVDHIYPVTPRAGASPVARVKNQVVGTHRVLPGGGTATFLGYRPRDDQSRSLGYEARNWFEVLTALGAYPSTGRFSGVNDNTEHVSRNSDYLACRFPNGAIGIARHLRELEEGWPGGFGRDERADREYIERHPLPPDTVRLEDFKVQGHSVTYSGSGALSFRVNARGDLVAFAGGRTKQITIDGRTTVFADNEISEVAWAPVAPERRLLGGAVLQLRAAPAAVLRIPDTGLPATLEVVAEGPKPGSRGAVIPSRRENGALVVSLPQQAAGKWLYAVPASRGYSVEKDIEFAKPGGVSLRLDAHVPPGKGPFPAVILVHGGGWSAGDKTCSFIAPLFDPLNETGMAWFTIDYRLAPRHPYPAAVEDVASAVRFVRQHAAKFKVDRNRIALMGESAGAHLVSLVGARNRAPANVAAVVSFYGPFDMVEHARASAGRPVPPHLRDFFLVKEWGDDATRRLREASPAAYISPKSPPFLLIHGTSDALVPYAQSTLAQSLLRKAGVACDLITVEGGAHGVMNWETDPRFQAYKTSLVAWLQKTLKR